VIPPAAPLARLDTTRSMPEVMTDLARTLDKYMAGGDP
jgi:hypothetical protein